MITERQQDEQLLSLLHRIHNGASIAEAARSLDMQVDYSRARVGRIKRDDLAMSGENADSVASFYKPNPGTQKKRTWRAVMKWEN